MEPLAGIEKLGFFTSRFEADAVVAKLSEAGIQSAVLGDPASQIAPHLVTAGGFEVAVAARDVDQARELVVSESAADANGPPSQPLGSTRTRRQMLVGWLLIATFAAGPIVVGIRSLIRFIF